jgi:hypothetical protein
MKWRRLSKEPLPEGQARMPVYRDDEVTVVGWVALAVADGRQVPAGPVYVKRFGCEILDPGPVFVGWGSFRPGRTP